MATIKSNSSELADVQNYLEGVGKYLTERLYGPHGPAWGTTFADLEELTRQIGDEVAKQLLQQSLQRQAAEPLPAIDHACPSCQRAGQPRDPLARVVTTDVGDAHWLEPTCFCTRCRRAFFPSVQKFGD